MKLDDSIKMAMQVKRLHRLYLLNKLAGETEEVCPLCEGESSFYDPNREHISERSFDCRMCGGKGTISKDKYQEWQGQFPKKVKEDHRVTLKKYLNDEFDKWTAMIPQELKNKLPSQTISAMHDALHSDPQNLTDYIGGVYYRLEDLKYGYDNNDQETMAKAKELHDNAPFTDQWTKIKKIAKLFNPSTYESDMEKIARNYDLFPSVNDLHKYIGNALKSDY